MATTVLFIEHLITGFQASIWFTLFVLSLFGYEWIDLNKFTGTTLVLTLLIISIIYPFGVFVDNIADDILKSWNRKIRKKYIQDETHSARRLLAITKDEALADYLGYVRTRIRISRSASLNFLLITISSIAFTATRLQNVLANSFWKVIIFELVVGVIVTTVAIATCHRISHTFARQIKYGLDDILE